MAHLFIDTTVNLILGTLSKEYKWIEYEKSSGIKSSKYIHGMIHTLLNNSGMDFSSIDNFFYVAGPGSYTGMRLSEGMAQIIEWQGLKINSFYHFEVPKLLGFSEGLWYSNAYKGEYFVCQWNEKEKAEFLVDKRAFQKKLDLFKDKGAYTHFINEKEGPSMEDNIIQTSDLIKEKSEIIFSEVRNEDIRRSLYYYRSQENEFKIPDGK